STLNNTVGASFYAPGAQSPTSSSIQMAGTMDPVHDTASVNVFVTLPGHSSATHYQLTTITPSTSGAQALANSALSDLTSDNWAAIYSIASSAVTSRYTESQFAAAMSAQSLPAITKASFSGSGTTLSQGGDTLWIEPVTFIAGGTTYTANLDLDWESGQWRFAGTTTPQPSS
ncbi:MAG TPA: hypothetical protein VMS00_15745, partial [Acidimicrobiales bacterium]|nr:hypothetical protein [Acidimicrobiales bacterium]